MKNTNEIRCIVVCRNCKMGTLIVFGVGTESSDASMLILKAIAEHNVSCSGGDEMHEMQYFFN